MALVLALIAFRPMAVLGVGAVDPTFHAALDPSVSSVTPPGMFLLDQRQATAAKCHLQDCQDDAAKTRIGAAQTACRRLSVACERAARSALGTLKRLHAANRSTIPTGSQVRRSGQSPTTIPAASCQIARAYPIKERAMPVRRSRHALASNNRAACLMKYPQMCQVVPCRQYEQPRQQRQTRAEPVLLRPRRYRAAADSLG